MTFTSDLLVQRTVVGQRISVKEQGNTEQFVITRCGTVYYFRLSMPLLC